jgi:hypothetical protein
MRYNWKEKSDALYLYIEADTTEDNIALGRLHGMTSRIESQGGRWEASAYPQRWVSIRFEKKEASDE